jgi:hypothetical protein
MNFSLSSEQYEKIAGFIIEQDKIVAERQGRTEAYYGACDGGYSYRFTPTSLGTAVVVINNLTKAEINVSDYENW